MDFEILGMVYQSIRDCDLEHVNEFFEKIEPYLINDTFNNVRIKSGLLNVAIENECIPVIEYLISHFIEQDLNHNDLKHHVDYGYALSSAASIGNLSIVKCLFKMTNVNVHERSDLSLRLACSRGHIDVVDFLLQKGATIDAGFNESLYKSIFGKHFDIAKLLLKTTTMNHFVFTSNVLETSPYNDPQILRFVSLYQPRAQRSQEYFTNCENPFVAFLCGIKCKNTKNINTPLGKFARSDLFDKNVLRRLHLL